MTTDNVVDLPIVTTLPLDVGRILDRAKAANMSEVVVLGYDADGEFYFAASESDGGTILWLLEVAKRKLMEAGGV